ncbi:Carbon monoxide dehydrogenase small chain [Pigmentiphaga humi]|uniref:Carbon monoxide dehydrogenase small chain n=1 Tax=Pigmentiphaga humi TaxID=2478468 RepID=A0A3P4AW67_9BURK|nr:(2Fe-2S)-binding protein [Pigmentiphaga humi]VCU68263.1 Carbon monoxide dehydrogenase small chain [Pigmentiphaga humi]
MSEHVHVCDPVDASCPEANAAARQQNDPAGEATVTLRINGREVTRTVPCRLLLADFLRHHAGLTGTHIGCEHGVCGACTVMVDGATARSCLMFAVQAAGCDIGTVEGMAAGAELDALQEAFKRRHALQCGFCTPGFLAVAAELLRRNPDPSADEVRAALDGNLCRCTGYINIVAAVLDAAARLRPDR